MKKLIASVVLLGLPALLLAQVPVKKAKAKVVGKAANVAASRSEIKATASQMATGISAAEAALTPAELAIAERVFQGRLPCELGAYVTLTADAKSPGYFDVSIKNLKYRMFPVETSTGAIRLEDRQAGAVWLQLANKSMLMSQKLGQRLADECKNPDQAVVAEMLIRQPPPSLLEPLPVAALVQEPTSVAALVQESTPVPAQAPPAEAAPVIQPVALEPTPVLSIEKE